MAAETSSGLAPLVSVIIPTFNRRELVLRAIRSALSQTYRPIEVIVQDDGSSDRTAEAVAELVAHESSGIPIFYEYQSNRGLAAARNGAIRRSHGELIALLDSDDEWTTDKLEKCVAYLRARPDVDVVYSPMLTVDADGQPMRGHDRDCHEGWLVETLFRQICIHDPAAVFYRRVWERVGGFDESLSVCVGHNFWLRVALGHRFGLIPEPLAIRTWLKDSLTRGRKARVFRTKAEMLYRFYEAQGGRERIDRQLACRALAKAGYVAGRLALLEGDGTQAVRLLGGSLHYRPALRTRLLWWAARVLRWWNQQPVYQESPLVMTSC